MNRIVPLMQREWLQHRSGWLAMVAVPLALGLLFGGFAQLQIEGDHFDPSGLALPALAAVASIAGSALVLLAIVWFASFVIVFGLARRDYGDRSVEFWLSMPVGHAESLLSPMLVHLLLAPLAAVVIGLAGGYAISLAVVGRLAGVAAWFSLPWGDIVLATLAIGVRLLAGVVLATLWLLPLVLAVVLTTAWFRKWAWVVIGAGIGLASLLLDRLFGQPMLSQVIHSLGQHAMHALVNSPEGIAGPVRDLDSAYAAVRSLAGWAFVDLGRALRDLASPLLAGGLLFSAGCFALLVQWRRRSAGAME